jgi:hypothetical protein
MSKMLTQVLKTCSKPKYDVISRRPVHSKDPQFLSENVNGKNYYNYYQMPSGKYQIHNMDMKSTVI